MGVSRDPYNASSVLDPSSKAVDGLNSAISSRDTHEDIVVLDEKLQERIANQEESTEQEITPASEVAETVPEMRARDARFAAQVLETTSDRNSVRLVIFTKNSTVRELGSLAQRHLLELGGLFAEIHVILLSVTRETTDITVRLADNIWLYSTESKAWWKAGFDAYRLANTQLVFAGGFRADIVIADDPFEAGVAAYYTARKYNRPFQVHVLEDIYDDTFKEQDPHNGLRLHLARFVLKRTQCVRTNSEYMKVRLIAEHQALKERVEVFPLYYNLAAWRDMSATFDLKERYPQFKFIILHVSNMHGKSHTLEMIEGVVPLLRIYPTVGLVIVGNGPERPVIEKHVIALGIHNQVRFEPASDEWISHMKSSNVLIHLSEDPEEDVVVLAAAAVRLPIIASDGNVAGTLFTDSESAFLCHGADPTCVSYRLRAFLNDNLTRTRFSMNAQEVVFERIEQDYMTYLNAYRSSIERCA